MTVSFDYDLFVIGGGSGGVRAARVSASSGAKVALAEESRLGGTCVIRGCVPKKLMVFASGYGSVASEARDYGWSIGDGTFEWAGFHGHLREELVRLEGVYRSLLDGSGVEIFDMRARLVDPHEVELADGSRKSAKHILIATGGHAVRPAMANAELGLTSNDVFLQESLPKSILIIGGGYIACEFACIFNGLGVEVTQHYRGAQILRGFDDEARGLVAEAMKRDGIDLHLGTNIVQMRDAEGVSDTDRMAPATEIGGSAGELTVADPDAGDALKGGPVWVKSTNGQEQVYDRVMFATGRAPNTAGLGLEELGINLGRKKEIVVDQFSQTNVPSVYAIGDVTNRIQLTPVAIREGMAFAKTVFEGVPTPVDHDLVASAVFTQPELGTVGLTEEAAAENEEIDVYCTSFRPMNTAFIRRPDRVLFKLIVSKASRKILGCHIVAPGAGELIQMVGIAVKMGATKEDFDRTVAVHPTISEELVTMRDPVRTG
ncbi:MAG: FAD-dependent oxidoreductase [Pseudomonadota bacterium]